MSPDNVASSITLGNFTVGWKCGKDMAKISNRA